jgi:hypothetical protein
MPARTMERFVAQIDVAMEKWAGGGLSFPIDASSSVRRVDRVPQCLGRLGRG